MIAGSVQIALNTKIQRIRILKTPGKVLVRKGERVKPDDVIAETKINSNYFGLDVARGLGVSAEEVKKHFNFPSGREFRKGDILAGPRGITKRIVRAPFTGTLQKVYGGVAILKESGKSYYLKAGLSGKVVDLCPQKGAVIESKGAVVQGVWGNGKLGAGYLLDFMLSNDANLLIGGSLSAYNDRVVFSRIFLDKQKLIKIKKYPLKGLILPSVTPNLITELRNFPYAVIVLEGFGTRPMNSESHSILSNSLSHFAEINAEPWERKTGNRPEIIIPDIKNGDNFEFVNLK